VTVHICTPDYLAGNPILLQEIQSILLLLFNAQGTGGNDGFAEAKFANSLLSTSRQ